jgi:hypothetical protein
MNHYKANVTKDVLNLVFPDFIADIATQNYKRDDMYLNTMNNKCPR